MHHAEPVDRSESAIESGSAGGAGGADSNLAGGEPLCAEYGAAERPYPLRHIASARDACLSGDRTLWIVDGSRNDPAILSAYNQQLFPLFTREFPAGADLFCSDTGAIVAWVTNEDLDDSDDIKLSLQYYNVSSENEEGMLNTVEMGEFWHGFGRARAHSHSDGWFLISTPHGKLRVSGDGSAPTVPFPHDSSLANGGDVLGLLSCNETSDNSYPHLFRVPGGIEPSEQHYCLVGFSLFYMGRATGVASAHGNYLAGEQNAGDQTANKLMRLAFYSVSNEMLYYHDLEIPGLYSGIYPQAIDTDSRAWVSVSYAAYVKWADHLFQRNPSALGETGSYGTELLVLAENGLLQSSAHLGNAKVVRLLPVGNNLAVMIGSADEGYGLDGPLPGGRHAWLVQLSSGDAACSGSDESLGSNDP